MNLFSPFMVDFPYETSSSFLNINTAILFNVLYTSRSPDSCAFFAKYYKDKFSTMIIEFYLSQIYSLSYSLLQRNVKYPIFLQKFYRTFQTHIYIPKVWII